MILTYCTGGHSYPRCKENQKGSDKNKSVKASFSELKAVTQATAGNLSVQIKKLEAADYFTVEKSFKNNYPHTLLTITAVGEDAFKAYLKALKSYF